MHFLQCMCMLEFAKATASRQLFWMRYVHVMHYLFKEKINRTTVYNLPQDTLSSKCYLPHILSMTGPSAPSLTDAPKC